HLAARRGDPLRERRPRLRRARRGLGARAAPLPRALRIRRGPRIAPVSERGLRVLPALARARRRDLGRSARRPRARRDPPLPRRRRRVAGEHRRDRENPMRIPLAKIEEARALLRRHFSPTPLALTTHEGLSLKIETGLPTGTFKVRGAIYALTVNARSRA